MGNRFLTLLSNIFTDLNLTDMETCYKVFKKSFKKFRLKKIVLVLSQRLLQKWLISVLKFMKWVFPMMAELIVGKKMGVQDGLERSIASFVIMLTELLCRYSLSFIQ